MDSTRKELSPYSEQRVVLLPPEDSTPNWRRVEMSVDAPNLRDYWHVVRKHKWKIVACFLTAIFVTAVVIFSMTPIYTATTTLVIERKDPQVVNIKHVLADGVNGHRVNIILWLIRHNNPRGFPQYGFNIGGRELLFRFNVDGLRVAAKDRHTDGGCRHSHRGFAEDLARLVDHFHFFFSITAVNKNVDVRNAIERYLMREFLHR